MKRKYLILPLVAGWLLSGCGTAAEASAPCVIPWGVQFLAWVGVVAILIFVFGILLLFWPYDPSPALLPQGHLLRGTREGD